MGFMDSIFGGEESQTTSGFQNLPPEIRNAFTSFATQGTGLLGGGAGDAMFRPMGTTGKGLPRPRRRMYRGMWGSL
jgi:hypothetical protein